MRAFSRWAQAEPMFCAAWLVYCPAQARAVAELKTGMLLFPTGSADGSMLNVEDEMGNKGGVPAAAVEIAQ